MNPIEFDGYTNKAGERQGYVPLPMKVGQEFDAARGVIVSCLETRWKPTEAELIAILAGKPIVLQIYSAQHPPCWLGVEGVERGT